MSPRRKDNSEEISYRTSSTQVSGLGQDSAIPASLFAWSAEHSPNVRRMHREAALDDPLLVHTTVAPALVEIDDLKESGHSIKRRL